MTDLVLLGSTGSIGKQTLEIARMHPDKIKIKGLAAGNNGELLARQIAEFKPEVAYIKNKSEYEKIKNDIFSGTKLINSENGLEELASWEGADTVLVAVVGIAGLPAVMSALKAGKKVALANKESLVCGGKAVSEAVKKNNDIIYPVDSEHSAIFQCLQGRENNEIRKIILTASGGPFRNTEKEKLKTVTVNDALAHPTWNMGRKITVDSATLMNKGLEVIEARWLFDVEADKICPIIHPESVVHSAVEFYDGAVIAQMGEPDMKLPIMYALEYPQRVYSGANFLNLAQRGSLTFFEPDTERFPCLKLAFEALKMGGNIPCALNSANEVAVDKFLRGEIGFCDIPDIVEHTIFNTDIINEPTIEDIYATDGYVRNALR